MMSLRNLPTAASSRLQDRDEEWARLLIAILAEAPRALDVPVGTALYVFGSACHGHRAPSDIDILVVYLDGHLTQAHLLAESIRNATSPYLFDVLVLSTSEERELAFIETERATLIWPHDA